MNEAAQYSGVFKLIEPLYKVAIQLKTFIPLGTATKKVKNEKTSLAVSLIPLVNI